MNYFKFCEKNYIIGVSTGAGQTEITETEYNTILSIIRSKPTPPDGKDYHLCADLTWEEYELPPQPEPEAGEEDYKDALERLGVNTE